MKQIVSSTVFAVVAVAVMPLRAADTPTPQPAKACTAATLQGTYLLTARLDAPGYAPLTGVPQVVGGFRTFDGAGNIIGVVTVNAGGIISHFARNPGVYTLNADCTGTMTNSGLRHYDIFVAPDGSEAIAIRTDEGVVEILKLKRVSGTSD